MPKDNEQAALRLISLIQQHETFLNQFGECFIVIDFDQNKQVWNIESHQFKEWLMYQHYEQFGSTVSSSAFNDALTVMMGKTRFQSPTIETNKRIAKSEDSYFLDLGTSNWSSVKINRLGWSVIAENPANFIRFAGSLPLPTPRPGADIKDITEFLNLSSEDDLLLTLAFVLECMRPETPYPVLLLDAEQGSAKSTTQKYIKSLIDPAAMHLRVAPDSITDIFVAARNDHILSYNNISSLSSKEQDALCCLSTGGGYSKRKLFTDLEESMIDIKRPVILNGIGSIGSSADFLDRCILLQLPKIESNSRKSEQALSKEFATKHPTLLYSLLDLFANTLAILPFVALKESPRMTDFAELGTAMCIALGESESKFLDIYKQNLQKSNEEIIDANPVALGVQSILSSPNIGSIECNFNQLLNELRRSQIDQASLPKSPRGLASALKRVAPALRRSGILVEFDKIRRSDGFYVKIMDERGSIK